MVGRLRFVAVGRRPGLMKCGGGRGILADFRGCGFVLGGAVMCVTFLWFGVKDSGEAL